MRRRYIVGAAIGFIAGLICAALAGAGEGIRFGWGMIERFMQLKPELYLRGQHLSATAFNLGIQKGLCERGPEYAIQGAVLGFLAIVAWHKVRGYLTKLRTPPNRLFFMLLFNLCIIPGIFEQHPTGIDALVHLLLVAPLLNLGVYLLLLKSRLPAPLFYPSDGSPPLNVAAEYLLLVCEMVIVLCQYFSFYANGNAGWYELPISLTAIYLLLSFRAGLVQLKLEAEWPSC